ncbi:MAG: hypothetical protein EOP84_19840, partial [Verrucomicrobiaceae bacterium]
CMSHTAFVSVLVEAIGAAIASPPAHFPAGEESEQYLAHYGLQSKKYLAVHAGARMAIKRWPLQRYADLVESLRTQIALPIIFLSDEPLPPEIVEQLRPDEHIIVAAGKVDVAVFDAVISHALIFVGNDTGPKHLAAVRGVFTISVHMGQVNWNEWGQDGEGLIISRRVPCVGCGIEDPSECGKEMACLTQIQSTDVVEVVVKAYAKLRDNLASLAPESAPDHPTARTEA